jgi:hypothetical protein
MPLTPAEKQARYRRRQETRSMELLHLLSHWSALAMEYRDEHNIAAQNAGEFTCDCALCGRLRRLYARTTCLEPM